MAGERVTIQVESNIGEDGPLTVTDTMHQFIDSFELLTAAIAEEPGGETVKWRLVSMSKNSPATAVAEAYSADPAIAIAPLVYRGKRRFSEGMSGLAEGKVALWLEGQSHVAKSLFQRNLNGVGRTIFDLEGDAPRAVVVEKVARQGLRALAEAELAKDAVDKSRSEFGTIDAHVAEAKTWNGRPALYVRDRISGRVFPCILSDQLANRVGPTHSWSDAWSGKRVRVKGEIFYDKSGAISRVGAVNVTDVNPSQVSVADLKRINVLSGRSPKEHIDRLWGYPDE